MAVQIRIRAIVPVLAIVIAGAVVPSARAGNAADDDRAKPTDQTEAGKQADPRAGDPLFEQSSKLLRAVDAILQDTARNRSDARRLPSKDEFLVTPIWTETKEDREERIRELLDAALGIVTDVPIVDMQKTLDARRKSIREIQGQVTELRERQLTAPKDALLPGILNDTVESLASEITDLEKRVEANRDEITKAKSEIHAALARSGIEMSPAQIDLLLDSVLSSDLVKLVATFNAAKLIDGQLAKMVKASGDNTAAARKYFAMHAALFAMLVHAQDQLIGKIDSKYLPRLQAIERDVKKTGRETRRLLKGRNRPDQKRALQANLKSQKFAERVAAYYRSYLLRQRDQLARARLKAIRDLRIADNTYETVEASFQLRALIKDAASSFEALQKLETPGFDQIFKDRELRREFENLTRKLDIPTS